MQDNLKPQLVPVLMYLPFSYFLDIWKVYWLMNGSGCGRPLLRALPDCFTSHLLHSSCPLLLNIRDTSAHCYKLFCVLYLHLLINWRIYSWQAGNDLNIHGHELPPSRFLSRFCPRPSFCLAFSPHSDFAKCAAVCPGARSSRFVIDCSATT